MKLPVFPHSNSQVEGGAYWVSDQCSYIGSVLGCDKGVLTHANYPLWRGMERSYFELIRVFWVWSRLIIWSGIVFVTNYLKQNTQTF